MKFFGVVKMVVVLMLFMLALLAILVITEVYSVEQASDVAMRGVGVLLVIMLFFLAIGALAGDRKKK